MLAVPAEQLVGTHPGQDHLDVSCPGRLAHEQRVDRGRIADRLIEDVNDPRQHANDVRRDLDLVQRDPVAGRDLPGVHGVVWHGFQPLILRAERDGVRVDPGVVPMGQHGDDARVQAAAEKTGHRHVGDQMGGDGFLDHRAQVGRRPGRRLGRLVGDPPVVLDRAVPVRAEPGPGAAGQLLHPLDGAALLGQPVVEHRGDKGARLDPQLGADRRHQGLQLGGEHHPLAPRQEVERLDAERIPGQHEFTGALVEQREREHAAEPAQRFRAPGAPGLQDHLGVRLGGEPDPRGDQLGPQRPVVVQLTVVDQGEAVLGQRLVGGGAEVDDRKPAVAQLHGHPVILVTPRPRRVWAAVGDPVGHDVDKLVAIGLLVAPCDTAHVSSRPLRLPSRRSAAGIP